MQHAFLAPHDSNSCRLMTGFDHWPLHLRPSGRRLVVLVSSFLTVLASTFAPALSQTVPPPAGIEQLRRPGEQPLPAPDLTPLPRAPGLTVPDSTSRPPPTLSQGARVTARGFRFVGNTVVSEADLQAIAAPYAGRELGNAELDELRTRLTRRYVDAGYINSGALLPDQDVTAGIITFQIIEGRLTDILIGGSHRFRGTYLRDRLALGAGDVLNVNRLQEQMQILLLDPAIARISAELAPGIQRGEATLRADVTSGSPLFAGITASNERSPVVGSDQTDLLFGTRNVLGLGETFTLRAAGTSGLRDYFAGLAVPVNARGTLLQVRHQRTYSKVVEAPFNQLDIGAHSTATEVGLSHPLIEHPHRSLIANLLLAQRGTQAYFLGLPSPFIPGVPDGHTTVGALRLGLDWLDRTADRVFAARTTLSHGLPAFGATVGDGFPDSRFTALLVQAQWVQRVMRGAGQWVLRAEGQFADSPLLGPEKYSLGGMDNVRGYRKDVMVRDTGWFGSAEYRHTIAHLSLRGRADSGEGQVRLAGFVDMGQGRDRTGSNPAPSFIASYGAGVRWEPVPGFDIALYRGLARRAVATPTRTSQDRGLHLRVSYAQAF